jgi:hypothetical protein
MAHAREMLDTHPGTAVMDAAALVECIDACFDCARTCPPAPMPASARRWSTI